MSMISDDKKAGRGGTYNAQQSRIDGRNAGTRNKRVIETPRNVALTIFFDATEDIVDVVWEESFGIEHGLDHAGNGA